MSLLLFSRVFITFWVETGEGGHPLPGKGGVGGRLEGRQVRAHALPLPTEKNDGYL